MDRYRWIYSKAPELYEALVGCEDAEGRLLPALAAAADLEGDLVELGAGTGRLTRLLAPHARSVRAFDASTAMLREARRRLGSGPLLAAAWNHALPVPAASADLALAGWSLGHATGWNPSGWRAEIRACLAEMRRVLRPGGAALVLETLGTGRREPEPPTSALAELYALLESEGFAGSWLRTDYRFPDRDTGARLCQGFFGCTWPLAETPEGWTLPECTGLWSLRV